MFFIGSFLIWWEFFYCEVFNLVGESVIAKSVNLGGAVSGQVGSSTGNLIRISSATPNVISCEQHFYIFFMFYFPISLSFVSCFQV